METFTFGNEFEERLVCSMSAEAFVDAVSPVQSLSTIALLV